MTEGKGTSTTGRIISCIEWTKSEHFTSSRIRPAAAFSILEKRGKGPEKKKRRGSATATRKGPGAEYETSNQKHYENISYSSKRIPLNSKKVEGKERGGGG